MFDCEINTNVRFVLTNILHLIFLEKLQALKQMAKLFPFEGK